MSIKSKFCPRCGKPAESLHDSLCSECYIEVNKPSVPRSVSVKFCTVCESILIGKIWITASKPMEHYLERSLNKKIKLAPLEKLKKVKIIKLGKDGEISILSSLDGKKVERVKKANLEVLKFACPQCSRQEKLSITAILQIRTHRNVKDFISEVYAYVSPRNVVKVEERLHGLDFSFSDKRTARVLARRMKEKFKCSMRESAKQRGWDKLKHRALVQTTYILRQK